MEAEHIIEISKNIKQEEEKKEEKDNQSLENEQNSVETSPESKRSLETFEKNFEEDTFKQESLKQIIEKDNKQINKKKKNKEQNDNRKEPISTYILKYTRNDSELKKLSLDTGLKKAENCLYLINIELIDINSNSSISQDEKCLKEKTLSNPKNHLFISCHEVAAFSFDEIYEKTYSLEELCKENKIFKIFDSTDEAKIMIDEMIKNNKNNSKKIFIDFDGKSLKLHMKLTFFDKNEEIIFNIPKKILTDKEKNKLLPQFLKEIQDKMYMLSEENKKLKDKKLKYTTKHKKAKCNLIKNKFNNNTIKLPKENQKENKINSGIVNEDISKDINEKIIL